MSVFLRAVFMMTFLFLMFIICLASSLVNRHNAVSIVKLHVQNTSNCEMTWSEHFTSALEVNNLPWYDIYKYTRVCG